MSATVLQKFLENNLLEVKPNDEEFGKLKDAANGLSKGELKNLNKVVGYTLVVLDKDIPVDETLLEIIKGYIQKKSATVLSKSKDTPITTYRAVALEALYTRAMNNVDYARVIWLTASHLVPFYDLQRKQGVVKEFIQEIGDLVENSAMNQWSLSSIENFDIEQIDSFTVDDVKIDVGKLENYLKGAAGPWHGEPKNQHQVHRDPTNWSVSFGQMAAEGIEKVVNASFAKQKKPLNQIADALTDHLNKVVKLTNNYLQNGINSSFNRTQLLWWKEALYSKCQNKSYRELTSAFLPIVMAVDMSNDMEGIYPVSIDYFLKETLHKVENSGSKKITFQEYFEQLLGGEENNAVKELLPLGETSNGRATILQFTRETIVKGKFDAKEFYNQTGIKATAKISIADLSVIFFHELQVAQLTS